MLTCVVEYTVEAGKLDASERSGRAWIALPVPPRPGRAQSATLGEDPDLAGPATESDDNPPSC